MIAFRLTPKPAHSTQDAFVSLLDGAPPKTLGDDDVPYGWTNYYRRDDVSAVALFYLDKPENGLPRIAPREQRIVAVGERNDPEK